MKTIILALALASLTTTAFGAAKDSRDDRQIQLILRDPQIKGLYAGSVKKWAKKNYECNELTKDNVTLSESSREEGLDGGPSREFNVHFICKISVDQWEVTDIYGLVDSEVDLRSIEYSGLVED